jgi:hypothetical protein
MLSTDHLHLNAARLIERIALLSRFRDRVDSSAPLAARVQPQSSRQRRTVQGVDVTVRRSEQLR